MNTRAKKSAPGRKSVGGVSSSAPRMRAGQPGSRRAHTSEKAGSTPAPATTPTHIPGHPCLTYELIDSLLDWIAGGRSLRSWCAVDGRPKHTVILRALREDDDFRSRYVRAREDQADALVDECLDIAEDGRNDTYLDEKGNTRVDHDVIQRSKLRCEERHWLAGKLRPKVYGERIALDIEQPKTEADVKGEYQGLIDGLARLGFRRG